MDDLYHDVVTATGDYENPFYVTIANPSTYYYQVQMRLEEATEASTTPTNVASSNDGAAYKLVTLTSFSLLACAMVHLLF